MVAEGESMQCTLPAAGPDCSRSHDHIHKCITLKVKHSSPLYDHNVLGHDVNINILWGSSVVRESESIVTKVLRADKSSV